MTNLVMQYIIQYLRAKRSRLAIKWAIFKMGPGSCRFRRCVTPPCDHCTRHRGGHPWCLTSYRLRLEQHLSS
jgi:hypothetical protein